MAEREASRNREALLLKQKSRNRLKRIEKEGINAILFDRESDAEGDEVRKGRQQIGASDLIALLKSKYVLRLYTLSFASNCQLIFMVLFNVFLNQLSPKAF